MILMQWRGALGVFFTILLLCVITAGGHLYSPDEEVMFRVTESIATRARLHVPPLTDGDGSTFATRRGVNGREYAQYGIGNSLAAVPLYWAGALACKFIPAETAGRTLDFQTQLYAPQSDTGRGHALLKRFFVSFTGAFVAAATATLLYLLCRRISEGRYSPIACWVTALAYGACTLALPHARTFFSEPLATLFVLLTFYLLYRPGHGLSNRRAALAGAAFALALMTRLDSLFAFPGVGVVLLGLLPAGPAAVAPGASPALQWLRSRLHGRSFMLLAAFAAPCAAFFAWLLLMNYLHFGSPFSSAYADQPEGINFSTPLVAGLYGFFMSVGKSLFLFSPALLLGIFGISRFRRDHPLLAAGLGLSIVGILLVHASWQNWAGGWCWGPRHIFMVHALLMIPAVAWLSNASLPRRLSIDAILLVGFLVQIYGTSQNFIDYYVLYYRTPFTPPNARVLYGGEDLAPGLFQSAVISPEGEAVPYPVMLMPAPISDSIYVPQNSQWYRYAEMWNLGYTDNMWLRLLQRSRAKEMPVL